MQSRRAVLSAVGLALAGAAGCVQGDGDPSGSSGDGSTAFEALPEPRLGSEAQMLLVADVDLAALRDSQGALVEQDGDLGDQAASFVEEFPAFDPEGVDRLTVQLASGSNVGGESLAAVVEGDVEADAVEAWIDEEATGEYETGEYDGYSWYAPQDAVIAVGDQRVLVQVSGQSSDAGGSLAEATVDAASSDGRWFADDDHLTATVDELAGHPNVVGGSVSADALADPREDSPIQQLAAGGLGTTPETDGATVDVLAQFRENASQEAFRQLLTQFTGGLAGTDPLVEALEYERDGSTVRASASVDGETLSESPLEPIVRFPPFLYFGSISSGGGERPRTPQVMWEFDQQSDGRVEITHAGGDAIEKPLTISYVVDGERVEERWAPDENVVAGDSYVTEQPGDPGTRLRVEWPNQNGGTDVLGEHAFS